MHDTRWMHGCICVASAWLHLGNPPSATQMQPCIHLVSCIALGLLRDQAWVPCESTWAQFLIDFRMVCDIVRNTFGIGVGSLRHHLGVGLESLRDRFEVTVRPVWEPFGIGLRSAGALGATRLRGSRDVHCLLFTDYCLLFIVQD